MPRFGFRKILNHYKDSHEEHSSATEQQLDNHSNQTERDVISCEENDSVATELTESMPSHEQFHIDDEMELQPTADTQFGRQGHSDYSLPAGRKFIRPKLNARRNSSRRPKAMRQRKSCAICGKQREISVGYASDGCICDACNATILSTFKNFMDRSQRFPSGQQQQEEETQPYHEYGQSLKQQRSQSQSQSQQRPSIHSQVEQPIYSQQRLPFPSQPPSTLSQKRPSAQLVEGQEMHYNQQASQTQQAQQPTANQGDVPPFSIVVLQDCENINQLIEQLKSVLVQMLPQQCNNANNKNNNNNRSSNNNNNRSNNGSFDYGRNYTDNRCPLSQANTCSCSPPVYYGTDASSCTCEAPSNQQNREHNFNQPRKYDWRERLECDCSCDMDAGSEQSNKRKNRKKNHKKKANKNKNNKNRRNNANNNQNKVDEDDDDCDCSIIDDNEDDATNCSGCNCVCCKQNSNNETLFKLFVQILQILRDSAKDTESSKKGKKSKKGKGSKKGKKDAEDSEKKEGNGKSKGKANAKGNRQMNNSNLNSSESNNQRSNRDGGAREPDVRRNCPPECIGATTRALEPRKQQAYCCRTQPARFKCCKHPDRVGAGDATKCGNIGQWSAAKGFQAVAHYRPGTVMSPVTYLLAENGECVRRSLVRTAAGATLHERVQSEAF